MLGHSYIFFKRQHVPPPFTGQCLGMTYRPYMIFRIRTFLSGSRDSQLSDKCCKHEFCDCTLNWYHWVPQFLITICIYFRALFLVLDWKILRFVKENASQSEVLSTAVKRRQLTPFRGKHITASSVGRQIKYRSISSCICDLKLQQENYNANLLYSQCLPPRDDRSDIWTT